MSETLSQSGHEPQAAPEVTATPLSAGQRARIERSRQRALLLRQSKESKLSSSELQISGQGTARDSGAGFLVEEPDNQPLPSGSQASSSGFHFKANDTVDCEECQQKFCSSFLRKHFKANICDSCREPQERHDLITKTEAKSEYLLKDCDLDKREPKLAFILKKNPHERARGDMKLYLRLQVEERALEVWGSEEGLEEEREQRSGKRRQRKQKAFLTTMKQLRMSVRSSLYTKQTSNHVHEYGEETYHEERDVYEKTCPTCGHLLSYEKM